MSATAMMLMMQSTAILLIRMHAPSLLLPVPYIFSMTRLISCCRSTIFNNRVPLL